MTNDINAIYFDLDGTIAGFYDVPSWLADLEAEHTKPYREAKPLVDMRKLGKMLHMAQNAGLLVGIISCTSKNGTNEFNQRIADAKLKWLKKHIGSVDFDEIHIIGYYMEKYSVADCSHAILFDDEQRHRDAWTGIAYDEKHIFDVLNSIIGE